MKYLYLVTLFFSMFFQIDAQAQENIERRMIGNTEFIIVDRYNKTNNSGIEISQMKMPAPANDNCASATNLTVGAALTCGQTTDLATVQAGECNTSGGGISPETVWYRFTAAQTSEVINFIRTNNVNCYPIMRVFGPFAAGAGCIPGSCAAAIYNVIENGDPGEHALLTGLTVGSSYLIQIQGNNCGGGNDRFTNFCISVANPATNSVPSSSSVLNACGTAFSGTTNGGYYNSGTGTRYANLDGNAATTCGGCTAGDDVPFVINNVAWFTFCSATAGTWSITVNGIAGCQLAAPNAGIQASIFTGTTTALVNQGNSGSPLAPGSSWTSPTITVNSGSCAYLMIDGFAGDGCNYSVTLTNVSGGCIVLPIELLSFDAFKLGKSVQTKWVTATELNNDYFTLEKSKDGINWQIVGIIDGAGNSNSTLNYSKTDANPYKGTSYYRLKQTDYDGNYTYSNVKSVEFIDDNDLNFEIVPNPAGEDGGFSLNFNHISDADYTIAIMDLTGKMVYSKNIQITDTKVEVNELLAKGMYVLQLRNADYLFTKKLIIK